MGIAMTVYPATQVISASDSGTTMHKVIAAAGVFDRGQSGVTLWHDYGSFALY